MRGFRHCCLLLLAGICPVFAQDKAASDIKTIYAAKDQAFLPLKGVPIANVSGDRVWSGTVPLAGLQCRMIEKADDPRGNVYDCSSRNWPETKPLALTPEDAEKAYDEIKGAVDLAIPGIRWFNVGPYGKQQAAGFDRTNLIVDLRLMGGPKDSVVSFTITSKSFRRDTAD